MLDVMRKRDFQIRGIPTALVEKLRQRAARKGVSMSQYAVEVLRDDLERPTMEEWLAEVRRLPPIDLPVSAAEILREARREEGFED